MTFMARLIVDLNDFNGNLVNDLPILVVLYVDLCTRFETARAFRYGNAKSLLYTGDGSVRLAASHHAVRRSRHTSVLQVGNVYETFHSAVHRQLSAPLL